MTFHRSNLVKELRGRVTATVRDQDSSPKEDVSAEAQRTGRMEVDKGEAVTHRPPAEEQSKGECDHHLTKSSGSNAEIPSAVCLSKLFLLLALFSQLNN